jgi:hypothetical protein
VGGQPNLSRVRKPLRSLASPGRQLISGYRSWLFMGSTLRVYEGIRSQQGKTRALRTSTRPVEWLKSYLLLYGVLRRLKTAKVM